ncbi:protein misato [Onthophagus taurus]|uniref:protein misato n=1 Tax=Onthophagus taurus TaxID=166361 RepID=UPI0039BE6F3C
MNNYREICTLQFGHYANFVGTHWWNIQEHGFVFTPGENVEINNKILYREGQTLKGEPTYTPRLLLVDLDDSLGSLPKEGCLYYGKPTKELNDAVWDENSIQTQEQDEIVKNQYLLDLESNRTDVVKKYELENNVNVWSDFLYTQFHPETVTTIKEYQQSSDVHNFNVFPLGKNLWKTQQFNEQFCDSINSFVEECDNMQGFQTLFDGTDGFAGLSSSCIEHLRDEYHKKSILAIPIIPSHYKDYDLISEEDERKSQINDSLRIINLAMCFHDLSELSSIFIPLSTIENGWKRPFVNRSFKNITYNNKLPYHTSSLLAIALDTFTLKYRLKKELYTLDHLTYDLCQHNRKLVAASLCMPFPLGNSDNLLDTLDKWDGPLTQSITPNYNLGSDRMLNVLCARGISQNKLKKPSGNAQEQFNMPAYKCETVEEMLKFYLSCTSFGSASQVISMEKGLEIKAPTPNIFNENIKDNPLQVLAGLHSGNDVGNIIDSLLKDVKKLNFKRFHQFIDSGVEVDDFKECIDKLMDFKDCYEDGGLI